jgi:hypothetical protein
MKNLPKNSKISLFKKTWVSAQQDAKSANKKALEAGKILSELKEENIGSWTKFVEVELDGFIGIRQADKLIKCYENKLLIALVSNNEPLTINAMIKIIAEADHEQLAQVEQLKKEEELAEIAKLQAAELAKAKKDDVIDGVFVEVKKPVPVVEIEPEFDEIEELRDLLDEQHSANKALQDDNDSMLKTFESNEPLTIALEELKKSNAMNRILNERINGLMNEKNEAIRNAKMWKGQFERLEKKLKAA